MEHKTEVDLPFTVGSTATSSPIFLADTERDTHKYSRKQVLGNRTFSMNSKRTLYFFYLFIFLGQINNKAPLILPVKKKKKKIISVEMDDGLLCWRENSCNRNGNVLPLSDHVQFEMHSPGGNLS